MQLVDPEATRLLKRVQAETHLAEQVLELGRPLPAPT